MSWLEALILGALQGVTEFLPISSDGHLVVFEQAFAALGGAHQSGEDLLFFNVMLHLGTLAAILVYYRGVIRSGWRGLTGAGAGEGRTVIGRPQIVHNAILACVATLPAVVVGLTLKDRVEAMTADPIMAGYGFLVTAAALLLTLRLPGGTRDSASTAWYHALLIGVAQAVAILPGVSRSGMTIATALALGFSRPWAAGFSLLIAVPAISGAVTLEVTHVDPAALDADRVAKVLAATATAAVVGYAAVIWLVKIVRAGRLWYFSVYLLVLAAAVLATFSNRGGGADVRASAALDGPLRGDDVGPARPGVPRPLGRADGDRARPPDLASHRAGPRP